MPKLRRVLGGALLTAATTALTVKGALTSPIGALVPTDQLQHDLRAAKDATLTQSKTVLTQAQQRLVAAIVRAPSEVSPSAAPTSNGQVVAAESKAREDPEPSVRGAAHVNAHRILREAALRHQLDPRLVLAVSYWESGWNQAARSYTGAVGLMQVEPYTAIWAGPALLRRRVNLNNPVDNAELGAALLRSYLDRLRDPKLALAAYYQGLAGVLWHGIYPSSRTYVDGIWRLRNQFQAIHLGG